MTENYTSEIMRRYLARYAPGVIVRRSCPVMGGPCGDGVIVRVGLHRHGCSVKESCFVDWGNRRSWYPLWGLRVVREAENV